MRMVHYYLVFAILLPFALFATAATGIWFDGGQRHLALGLFTAILCVAMNVLVVLFTLVTGRVLRAAIQTRPLSQEYLVECNSFFATKSGYPMAMFAASAAVVTAVLGYGRNIGVPQPVHMLMGLFTVLLNLYAIRVGYLALLKNQRLLDGATAEMDRIDREEPDAVNPAATEVQYRFDKSGRWVAFAVVAWVPYLYWGLVVWRGAFSQVSPLLPIGTVLISGFGLFSAWSARRRPA